MATTDDLIGLVADALEAAGFIASVQEPSWGGHVAWGDKSATAGPISGVRRIAVQDRSAEDWPIIAMVRVADESDHNGYHDLGYAYKHKRTGTRRWRIAEGYVNGFPLRDILYYTLTRWKVNGKYLRRWRNRRSAVIRIQTDTIRV